MAVSLMKVLHHFLLPIITIPILSVYSKSLEEGLSFDEKVFTFLTPEEGSCSVGKTVENLFLIIGCDNSLSDSRNINTTDGRHVTQHEQCLVRPSEKKDNDSSGDTDSLLKIFVVLSNTCGSLIDERIENSSSHICISLTKVSDICKQKSNVTLNVTGYLDKGQGYGFPFTTVKIVIKTPITSTSTSTPERYGLGTYGLSPFLLVDTKEIDCSFDQHCQWTDFYGELNIWPTTRKVICDYCNRLSLSERFGYWDSQGKTTLSSPYIHGSLNSCNLSFESNVIGKANLSVWLVHENESTLLELERIDSGVWQSHHYHIGEQNKVFEIHIVISIKGDNSFLALRKLKFSGCRSANDDNEVMTNTISPFEQTTENNNQDSVRECNFNEPCQLIRQKSSTCRLELEDEDPIHDLQGGFLFTSGGHCTQRGDNAWFNTILFQPQPKNSLNEEECKITFSIYGKAMWIWWLCEGESCIKRLNEKRNLQELDSLKTYEMTINNVRNKWFLKFETKELYISHYLGIKRLTASSACFNKHNMTHALDLLEQTTEKRSEVDEFTTENPTTDWLISADDSGDNYKLVVIPVTVLCLLLLMLMIIIGINRRKLTQLQMCRGSRKVKDQDMSISELLTVSHNGKTLDRILTEGNPNYNWFQHKFQHGYIRFYDRSRININNVLGKGAFGEVYKGTLLKVSKREKNKDVAIKKLSSESTEKDQNNFLIEAFTLCKFNHKNIVRCLGISSDNGQFAIILELMVGGDLKSFLRCTRDTLTQRSTLKVEELIRLALDIASGCCYLEANKFVHRDVAARNCLLTTHGTNRVAKIADFGLARDIVMKDYYKKEGRALLPIRWMPPEAYQDGLFTVKSDVWAFGILLWEIFTSGFIPYPGLSNDSVMRFVSRGGRLDSPGVCPQEIYDLMLQCWSCLQSERPSFQKIFQKLTLALKNSSNWDQDVDEDLEKPHISLRSTQYYVRQLCQEEVSPLM